MYNKIKIIITLLAFALVAGCATSRGTIDISDESYSNPAQGTAVKFIRITDNRDFQVSPKQADIPSLMDNQISNKAITSRAIARKRNGYGKALGDILLPEGKTIMGVVENRLSKGFAENGFRVLSSGDAGYDSATPVEVDIEKFWGWFSPGFWSIGINFETTVKITAPLKEFRSGVKFDSKVEERFQTAVGSNWQTVINKSLDELNKDIQNEMVKIQASSK